MTPVVAGALNLDLSAHVDRDGLLAGDARASVHRVLACCPAGITVRVGIGRATWVADSVLDLLSELLATVAFVEIEGTDDRGLAYVIPRLRSSLSAR